MLWTTHVSYRVMIPIVEGCGDTRRENGFRLGSWCLFYVFACQQNKSTPVRILWNPKRTTTPRTIHLGETKSGVTLGRGWEVRIQTRFPSRITDREGPPVGAVRSLLAVRWFVKVVPSFASIVASTGGNATGRIIVQTMRWTANLMGFGALALLPV